MEVEDILQEFETTARPSKVPTSAGLYQELVTAMLNERMAPDLFPYKHKLMARVLAELLSQQQFLLDSHEYGDSNAESGIVSADFKLQLMIIETDIERLSYLVRLYIRTRLAKIDNFTIYYIKETAEEAGEDLLSLQEKDYMHKHFKILTQLYNNSFLKKLPNFLTLLDDVNGGQSMITAPDVELPVFFRVLSEEPIILHLGNEGELELVNNGIYVAKYRLIKKYLTIGDIVLI